MDSQPWESHKYGLFWCGTNFHYIREKQVKNAKGIDSIDIEFILFHSENG